MIKVEKFSLDFLSSQKMFFLLNELPKNSEFVDVKIQTPQGLESVNFVRVFEMADGSLMATWEHPYVKIPLGNLIAEVDGFKQLINTSSVERILEFWNRPIDSPVGAFSFTNSVAIANGDWRCDSGMYGPRTFVVENLPPVIDSDNQINFYESFLSVAGVGHVVYVETTHNAELGAYLIDNSVAPVYARTFPEILRLIYEWSQLVDEPFNATDEVAIKAKMFLEAWNFSEQELSVIASMKPMQIAAWVSGSETARNRPSDIPPMTVQIVDILWNRMAYSCLSALVERNPSIWDLNEVVVREYLELEKGISRFKTFYGITSTIDWNDKQKVIECAEFWMPKQSSYIHTQLRGFENKYAILNEINNNR